MESCFLHFANALIEAGFRITGVSDDEEEFYSADTPSEALSLCRDVESATVHFTRLPERVDVFVIPELGDEDVSDYSCSKSCAYQVDLLFDASLGITRFE